MFNIYKVPYEGSFKFSVVNATTNKEESVFDTYSEAVEYVMSRRL
jgi:hypothetical protein